jgi:hypothetical protein
MLPRPEKNSGCGWLTAYTEVMPVFGREDSLEAAADPSASVEMTGAGRVAMTRERAFEYFLNRGSAVSIPCDSHNLKKER